MIIAFVNASNISNVGVVGQGGWLVGAAGDDRSAGGASSAGGGAAGARAGGGSGNGGGPPSRPPTHPASPTLPTRPPTHPAHPNNIKLNKHYRVQYVYRKLTWPCVHCIYIANASAASFVLRVLLFEALIDLVGSSMGVLKFI